MEERYYAKYAAAAVRGWLIRHKKEELIPESVMKKELSELTGDELSLIFKVAIQKESAPSGGENAAEVCKIQSLQRTDSSDISQSGL